MPRARRGAYWLSGITLGLVVAACAGRDPKDDYFGLPAPPDQVDGNGGAAGAPPIDNEPSTGPRGDFGVLDVDEAACDRVLDGTLLSDPESGRPVVRRLIASEGGWLAESSYDSGFHRLSAAGAFEEGPLQLGALDHLTRVGDRALVVSTNEHGVVWGSYSEGTGLEAAASVNPGRVFELAVGGGSELGLVTWATSTTVQARLLDADGPRGDVLDLLDGVITDSFRAAVAQAGDGLVVAWSTRRISDSAFVSRAVTVSAEGKVGPVRVLYESPVPHQVVDIVPTSEGALLLLEDDGAPLLVALSATGLPLGDALRFADGQATYSLARSGSRVLLAARHSDGRDALRVLDESGHPDGAWQCLHAEVSDDEHAVALAADDDSFVALFRDERGENQWLSIE